MNKKGFTLVELLATIVVLGLIMTIVATKGFGAFDNSKNAINKLTEKAIEEAVNLYLTEVENCDDEDDMELLEISGNFCGERCDTCDDLKEKFKNFENQTKINLSFLKNNDYISGNNLNDEKMYNDNSIEIMANIEYDKDGETQKRNITIKSFNIKYGDVNEDGDITTADSILITKYINKKIDFEDQQKKNADINDDGRINMVDVYLIKKFIADIYPNTLPDNPITDYIIYGDADEDGNVTLNDSVKASDFYTNSIIPTEQQRKNTDVNCDDKIDMTDAQLILDFSNNNLSEFPCQK